MNDTDLKTWLDRARDIHTASCTYFDSSVRAQVEADLRQFNGQHPSGSKYLSDVYKWRSRLFRPKTRGAIRKNEAIAAEAFFSTSDIISCGAEDSESQIQVASAAINQELLQYRLTRTIPWFQLCMGAYQEAMTVGVCISYQYWDWDVKKGRDRPCLDLLPIENFRFDPGAKWCDPVGTSPYTIQMIPMYIKDVKAMAAPESRTPWLPVSEEALRKAATPYGDTIRLARDGNRRTDPTDNQIAINDYTIVWVHRNIVEWAGEDFVYYTLATEAMLSDPVPIQQEYWHGNRPYVVGNCIIEPHRPYPASIPRLTKDTQAEINDLANMRLDNIKFALNKRYLVKRNRQVDVQSLTRNVPGGATMVQDLTDVMPIEFNDVTSGSFAEHDRLNLDFDDVAGSFSGASVQSNRRLNETVGGMNILTSNANQISGYQLRTFVETWVKPVLYQLVLLEQKYETDERIIALAGQKAKLYQRFGIDRYTDELLEQALTVNVNVGMSATNPHDQVEKLLYGLRSLRETLADGVLQKHGVKTGEVIKEVMGKLGYQDGARFFGENDPTITALQSQIDALQAALDAKHPPELLQAQLDKAMAETKRIAAQTVNENVRAIFAAMQAAQPIAAIPALGPVGDSVLASAGFNDANGGTVATPPPAVPAGIGARPLFDPRTGIEIQQSTDPMSPAKPASPEVGQNKGIETVKADSVA